MTDSRIDPERLAALLDGRLGEQERRELLSRLAESDADMEACADAIAIMRDLEAAEGRAPNEPATGELPLTDEPGKRSGIGRLSRSGWLALAASLLVLVAAPWVWRRAEAPSSDPGRFAALLGERVSLAEAGPPPWRLTRSSNDALSPDARAFRIGVRITDLELAERTRDSSARAIALEIADLLDGVPGGSAVAGLYREIARSESRSGREAILARGRSAASSVAGLETATLGAWAEAARIALRNRDASFFGDREVRRTLTELSRSQRSAAANQALDEVRGVLITAPESDVMKRALLELFHSFES